MEVLLLIEEHCVYNCLFIVTTSKDIILQVTLYTNTSSNTQVQDTFMMMCRGLKRQEAFSQDLSRCDNNLLSILSPLPLHKLKQ